MAKHTSLRVTQIFKLSLKPFSSDILNKHNINKTDWGPFYIPKGEGSVGG